MKDGRQHENWRKLHQVYGSVVRVGPKQVSVCDVSAVRSVLGGGDREGGGSLPKGSCESFTTST